MRDKVDILAGFALTPEALAARRMSKQGKKLMVVMNAATSIITEQSPYIVRTSLTIPQVNSAFGTWAYEKGGAKNVYTLVSDYGPGKDAEASFSKTFTAAGGTIVGSDRTPVANPDFSAFVQRVKDANPQAVYIFIPGGAQPAAIGKALADKGRFRPPSRCSARANSPSLKRSRAWAPTPRASSRPSTTRSSDERRSTLHSSRPSRTPTAAGPPISSRSAAMTACTSSTRR